MTRPLTTRVPCTLLESEPTVTVTKFSSAIFVSDLVLGIRDMKKCRECGVDKALTEYNKNRHKPDGLQSHCRDCSHKLFSRYYRGNRAHHKSVVMRRKKQRLKEYQVRIVRYLHEHPCVDCGNSDPIVLEFDHVRGPKRAAVANLVNSGASWANIEREIAKCEVRCANCHRKRTAQRGNHYRYAAVAKQPRQLTLNQKIAGATPVGGTTRVPSSTG